MNTPDDSHYYLDPEDCCGNWRVCDCPDCVDKRDYASELKREKKKDEDEH